MKNSVVISESLFIKVLCIGMFMGCQFKLHAQSFINFTSFNESGHVYAGVENNNILFAGYKANGITVNARSTFYPESFNYQMVQVDAGYDFIIGERFLISPRAILLSSYNLKRTTAIVNSDFELKFNKVRIAYSVFAKNTDVNTESRVLSKVGVFYQAFSDIAFYTAYGPEVNFQSYKNKFFIGPIYKSGKFAARLQYYTEEFNPKFSGLITSLGYIF